MQNRPIIDLFYIFQLECNNIRVSHDVQNTDLDYHLATSEEINDLFKYKVFCLLLFICYLFF